MLLILSLIQALSLLQVNAHQLQSRASALDKNLTNTVPNLSGPVLYYNGSGPVPGINTLSPEPAALPALKSVWAVARNSAIKADP